MTPELSQEEAAAELKVIIMLYTSLSCENLASEFDIRGIPVPVLHPLPQDPRRVVYKPKKSKGIFKRKKNKEQPVGFYDR